MEQNERDMETRVNGSRVGGGLFLLLAGLLLLAYKMGAPIPGWVFTWPVLLIAIGLLTGIKSRFHNPGSYILILIGSVFLVDQSIPGIDLHNYIAPIILIGLGLLFILRPRGHSFGRYRRARLERRGFPGFDPEAVSSDKNNEEYVDIHAVFGGVKKNIQSKNFKGGEITCFMGGAEISFMQADIQHPVVLEVNNVFGGTKLIIPGNWEVQTEISAMFGGVEDKRNFQNNIPDPDKKIILRGSCVFGGIEINNY
ncbi:MAG: cell wall-active antibiotics response protein [Bacteroidota bacterium]|nr:cell wall-active antibiotics response protein [Bacteroidota bacterium]